MDDDGVGCDARRGDRVVEAPRAIAVHSGCHDAEPVQPEVHAGVGAHPGGFGPLLTGGVYRRSLLSNGMTADFSNLRSAQASPLARALFQHPDVRNVLIASDFIAVTIGDAESWPRMKPEIFAALEDFFASGQPIISDANSSSAPNKGRNRCREGSRRPWLTRRLC